MARYPFSLLLAISLLSAFTAPLQASQAEFFQIGVFWQSYSFPSGLSGDGSTVVGSLWGSGIRPFRWTRDEGLQFLGYPASSDGAGLGVSHDGKVIVGSWGSRWESPNFLYPPTWIVHAPYESAQSNDVSSDGSVVAGWTTGPAGLNQAMRWSEATGIVPLGTLGTVGRFPDYANNSAAYGISADGSVIVGRSTSPYGSTAFRWTAQTGMKPFSLPGDAMQFVLAYDVSADGSTAVGAGGSNVDGRGQAVRWSADEGVVGLGRLHPDDAYSEARGVSADGRVIVGVNANPGVAEAFVWTESMGMRSIRDMLIAGGVDMTGWSLEYANAVSADGRVVVGYGSYRGGNSTAWLAVLPIPEPGAVQLLIIGLAILRPWRLKCREGRQARFCVVMSGVGSHGRADETMPRAHPAIPAGGQHRRQGRAR
jgi:probable HAF family extracellular repeat protein